MRRLCMATLAAALAWATGCANPRVTYTEFARIEKGVPIDKVVERIGPESRRKDGRLYFDGRYGSIVVVIQQGRVAEKWWTEPK